MVHRNETESLFKSLEKVAEIRQTFADILEQMAQTIEIVEQQGKHVRSSGPLGLEREIADLKLASASFKHSVFRLLVLGDIKQGKSTFLNALIGEEVLPNYITPCTAIITVLKYGDTKRVVINYNDGNQKEIDFETFKTDYTISPKESKGRQQEDYSVFPDIDYAEVYYPLPLLKQGIEIIDTPGLNDTETRNRTSLGYINNCHAVLFVMNAIKLLTLEEQRYLDDYIAERGITIFFIINQWDRIRASLLDPNDLSSLKKEEKRLRDYARINLFYYCQVGDKDIYDKRVFEISASSALKQITQKPPGSLDETGFPKLMRELKHFLTEERAKAEMERARVLTREIFNRVLEAIENRIFLLNQTIENLQRKTESVEPMFKELESIRDEFLIEIRNTKEKMLRELSSSFVNFINSLEGTFEKDFKVQQLDFSITDLLRHNRFKEFQLNLKYIFLKYISDKISSWTIDAEKQLKKSFHDLNISASKYGLRYKEITHQISSTIISNSTLTKQENPSWVEWSCSIVSVFDGQLSGSWLSDEETGLDIQKITLNLGTIIGVGAALMMTFGAALTPLGVALVGLGVSAWNLGRAKQTIIDNLKQEFVKCLPQIAKEQVLVVSQTVSEYFDNYERQIVGRIDSDLTSRRAELTNLLNNHKLSVDTQQRESERLRQFQVSIRKQWANLERLCDNQETDETSV